MKESKLFKTSRTFLIVLICLGCLIPFYILLVLSLNSPSRIFYEGNMFIPDFNWQNYADAWAKSRIDTAMMNSAIITAGTLLLTVVTGGLGGFAIARYDTRYNKTVFGIFSIKILINFAPAKRPTSIPRPAGSKIKAD